MLKKQRDLAVHCLLSHRHVGIASLQITVPLRNFVLKNEVISEYVRSETTNFAVVLMRICGPVREYDVGVRLLQVLRHPFFECRALIGKVAISEFGEVERYAVRTLEKRRCRRPRLLRSRPGRTKHAPMD